MSDVESPAEVLPGYETDLSAVGTNRQVDPDRVDDRPWYEIHGVSAETARQVEHGARLMDGAP